MRGEKTLNEMCAFGRSSSRHLSSLGKMPDLLESRESNLAIKNVLDRLAKEMVKRKIEWHPAPLSTYDDIGPISQKILNHTPSSFVEIFPLAEDRVVDVLFERDIASHNTTLSNALSLAYLDPRNAKDSKKATARHVLGLLQKKFPDFVASRGTELDLSILPVQRDAIKQGHGIPVSEEDYRLLLDFQDLQERFESLEHIRALNDSLFVDSFVKPIAEIVLGIQLAICKTLEEARKDDPEWFNSNSIAFEEIVLLDEKGALVPSSRFLKLILHNVGEYLVTSSGDTPETRLFSALYKALRFDIFHQKICMFRKENGAMRFDGVIDKLCPARGALSAILIDQLAAKIPKT